MAEKLRLNINGREVTGFPGQTVLEVAKENGIDIPTLCYDKRVEVYGACGLCVVEAEGNPKLLRACATTISDGMVINTNTKRVIDSRKAALELLLSDHTGDCRPPCALNCPAGTDCQGYVGMVANGQYKEAVKIIKGIFPLPSSIGRVCPHPCETACRRKLVDEPVSIAYIKAFIGDKDLESGNPYVPECAPSTGHTVAVIGGGPAGLTTAYHLRAKGHDVTVYDAMPKMGGMLRYGIPEYRLPKAVLDKEIELIASMGVKMINNIKLGRDITFEHIKSSYDAVLLATGAWTSTKMGVKGEDNKNVFGGIDFLRKVALGEEIVAGKDIAIVGGGNTAMDACRTAVRLGAEHVYCIYRRTKAEMPAEDIEIKEAEEEGVIFKFLTNPEEIVSAPDGSIDHVLLQKMELGEPDSSGRRRPVPVEGATEEIKVSSLIMALGQILDPVGLDGIELTKKGTISADETTFRTNIENVFAVGDATNKGAGIAIEAIGEAEKASHVIDSFLKGSIVPYKKPYVCERKDVTEETLSGKPKVPRVEMSHLSPSQRRDNFHEVNNGFTEKEAVFEASRCLECGCHDYYECKLVKQANDYDVKPEKYEGESHNRTIDNTHPFIDRNPDKCILCGLCVRVCDEVMGRTALGLVSRGFDTIVCPSLNQPLKETDCISCGQCINLCPTGALGEKFTYGKRVPSNTECTETTCSFCSVGCPTVLHTNENIIVKSTPAEDKVLCSKGRFGFGEMTRSGRLTTPLVRKDGELVPVSYEEAAMLIAKKMQSASVRFGNGAAAVSVSDKLTNEEIYAAKKYADTIAKAGIVFSFNYYKNGVKEVIGSDCSTCANDEILSTNIIMLVGTDLMNDHASFGVKVRQAAKRGAKLIVINDKPESQEAQEADLYINSDSTESLKAILKALIEKGAKASGIENISASLTDITVTEEAEKAASMLLDSKNKKAVIITDQFNTTFEAAKAAADIAVLSGHIGSPRNGIIQIKSNVNSQGLADLGITPICLVRDKLESGEIKAMFIIGEDPDSFERKDLEFLAVADIYLTETARKADVVLPLVSLVESSGTVISMDGKINTVNPAVKPLAKTNTEAIAAVANAMKVNFTYSDEKDIMREIIETGAFAQTSITPELKPVETAPLYKDRINTNVCYKSFENFMESEGLVK
ncbi:FAD-dependent oxidoreductase [Lachnospiraceae bacterium NSJ-143]|nr:FAD-dependent oxidoreductase [Lachnospiraceae bacterium NSJ-143]